MAVRSVGTLTRRHLKVRTPLKASEDATGASLTISTFKLMEVTFFFRPSAGPPPPLLPLVRDPRPATPLTPFLCFAVGNLLYTHDRMT